MVTNSGAYCMTHYVGTMWNFSSEMTWNSRRGSPPRKSPENVTRFPKIYYKLYDKKVSGILIVDPDSWKCDVVSWKYDPVLNFIIIFMIRSCPGFLKMWCGFLKMWLSFLKMLPDFPKCYPFSWKKVPSFLGKLGPLFGKPGHLLAFRIPSYHKAYKFWETRSHFREIWSQFREISKISRIPF